MDESSLRAQLNYLDALRSSLHSSFRFWDWVVVAGVALEFVVLAVEYCDEWRAFWRATIRSPEKPKTSLFLVGFCGIAMVAGGIAKELRIDSQIEGVETNIRGINEQLFGIVSKEAQDAASASKKAQEQSRAANDVADEAKGKIGAVANRAEEVDASLARTQYLLSARSVTDPDSLVKQLKQYKGETVLLGSYNSEPDEAPLCNQLVAAARVAEMKVPQDTCGRQSPTGNALTGVVISGPDLPQTEKVAQIIRDTSSLGPGGTACDIPAPELTIFVGAKPPFTIGQARRVKITKKSQTSKAKANP